MKEHNCGKCLHWDAEGEWVARPGFEHGERGQTGHCRPFDTMTEDYSGCLSFQEVPWWFKILRLMSR